MPENEPVVFLVEDVEMPDDMVDGDVYSGLFSGHVDRGRAPRKHDEVDGLTAAEAIAWGRERAARVLVRAVDDDEYFAAGAEDVEDCRRWPATRNVVRRRPPGQEWRDRSAEDGDAAWAVDVQLQPPSAGSEADRREIVAELSEQAGATEWGLGTPRVHPLP